MERAGRDDADAAQKGRNHELYVNARISTAIRRACGHIVCLFGTAVAALRLLYFPENISLYLEPFQLCIGGPFFILFILSSVRYTSLTTSQNE